MQGKRRGMMSSRSRLRVKHDSGHRDKPGTALVCVFHMMLVPPRIGAPQ